MTVYLISFVLSIGVKPHDMISVSLSPHSCLPLFPSFSSLLFSCWFVFGWGGTHLSVLRLTILGSVLRKYILALGKDWEIICGAEMETRTSACQASVLLLCPFSGQPSI